ncbi:MAG: prolyl oligopeptidase family serine peptidase [Burkholderiales bacterium]
MLAMLLAGCSAGPDHPSLKDASLPELIPAYRYVYRGNAIGGYQLSPDGTRLAWQGPWWGRRMLFVRDLASGATHRWRAGGAVRWAADSRHLLYVSDAGRNENQHVFAIDTATPDAAAFDLTPNLEARVAIQHIPEQDSPFILITHNGRDRRLADMYRVNLATRETVLAAGNPGDGVAPLTRNDGSLAGWQRSRAAQRSADDTRRTQRDRVPELKARAEGSVRILGPSGERDVVWAISSRGRDRMALVALHTGLGWERPVFEDPIADVAAVSISQVTRSPLIAQAQPGLPRVEILDSALKQDLRSLLTRLNGQSYRLDWIGSDRRERRLLLGVGTDTQYETWFIDRDRGTMESLGSEVPPDLQRSLSPMRPLSMTSRDGLILRGFLTLPRGAAPRRLPTVVLVHGGPWASTPWADPLRSDDALRAQFLANRGYAVLQVDYRGSTGYGRAFFNAGMGEFGSAMQNDLDDALAWAVREGISDPERSAIMGISYGGYATLVGLTSTPRTWACGVAINPPTDLASLIESFPPHWTVDLSTWHDFVGNPANADDRAAMTHKSPLTHAARLERPVLIITGGRDVRVRPEQSARMVAALRAAGKNVRHRVIAEMGHNPGYWAHHLTVLRETETHLRTCLGGRANRIEAFELLSGLWTRASAWWRSSAAGS